MPILYFSSAEEINKRKFDVRVPAYYHPRLPESVTNPQAPALPKVNRHRMTPTRQRSPIPFMAHDDPNQWQKASYTIAIMINMWRRKVEFEIVHDKDLPDIFDALDRYLISLKEDIEFGDEKVMAYAQLVVSWRAEVYKHYYRYVKRNADVMESLYPQGNKTKNIFHLMALVGTAKKNDYRMDPLAARGDPPFDIGKTKPIDKGNQTDDDDDVGSSLGLSNHHPLTDDGKDFVLGDFLGGGN